MRRSATIWLLAVAAWAGCGNSDASGPPPPPAVASVTVMPPQVTVDIGATTQLTAQVRDGSGNLLTGRTVSWISGDPAIATVDQSGLVRGVSAGVVSITATAEGRSGSASADVRDPLAGVPIVITQVAPATLVESQPATITGSGFSATPTANTVTVAGRTATVTQATATSLQIIVPGLDCRPPGPVAVQVRAGTRTSNVFQSQGAPASTLDMQVGDLVVLRSPADLCLQFSPSATAERYVFGVQAVSDVVATLTPVTISGDVPTGAAGSPPLASAEPPAPGGPLRGAADLAHASQWSDHIAITVAGYERERRLLASLTASPALLADRSAAVPTVPGTVTEGQDITIRFPNFDGNTCTESVPINVRVARIATRSILLVDNANPVPIDATTLDNAAAAFEVGYATAVDHYGDVSDMDGNGRIAIVITREVNRLISPPLGFVAYANYYPQSQCVASNEGEFVYIRAPDPSGLFTAGVYSVASFQNNMSRLLTHEFTHAIQGARRLAAGGTFMASWLAEGLATSAEEVLGFQVLGLQNGGNYGQDVVYTTRGADPRNYFAYVGDLLAYFGFNFANGRNVGAPEQCSWVGSTSTGNPGPCTSAIRLLYGVPWSLIKYTIDRLPGGTANQKQYLRAFSDYTGTPGFPELEAVLGRPVADILAEWAPMLYLDDRFPAAGHQFLNFNIPNVAAAWNTPNAHLAPRTVGFADFSDAFTVRAASSSYHEISGANRPATAVRVRDGAGAPLPAFMQLWIVRVQ